MSQLHDTASVAVIAYKESLTKFIANPSNRILPIIQLVVAALITVVSKNSLMCDVSTFPETFCKKLWSSTYFCSRCVLFALTYWTKICVLKIVFFWPNGLALSLKHQCFVRNCKKPAVPSCWQCWRCCNLFSLWCLTCAPWYTVVLSSSLNMEFNLVC